MTDRSEALARLAALGVTNDLTETPAAPVLELTGDEVYAGGDEVRILLRPAHLTYREEKGGELLYADAKVGDTILVDKAQAKRLDALDVTATKAQAKAKAAAPAAPTTPAPVEGKTDEELEAMTAAELVAHVNQHNADKVRVRALEGKRPEPRVSVLKATAPEGDDPDEELD